MKVKMKAPTHEELCLAQREGRWVVYRENIAWHMAHAGRFSANFYIAKIIIAEPFRRAMDHVHAVAIRKSM